MKGGRLSLSELSKASPNKRKSDQSTTKTSSVKPRAIIDPGNPDWPCPSPGCDGHIKVVKKKNGKGEFGSCDQRVYGDDDSCQVTTTILQPSKDNPKHCLVCNTPVGGSPTLGEPTEEKDDRGYTGKFSLSVAFVAHTSVGLIHDRWSNMHGLSAAFHFPFVLFANRKFLGV